MLQRSFWDPRVVEVPVLEFFGRPESAFRHDGTRVAMGVNYGFMSMPKEVRDAFIAWMEGLGIDLTDVVNVIESYDGCIYIERINKSVSPKNPDSFPTSFTRLEGDPVVLPEVWKWGTPEGLEEMSTLLAGRGT